LQGRSKKDQILFVFLHRFHVSGSGLAFTHLDFLLEDFALLLKSMA